MIKNPRTVYIIAATCIIVAYLQRPVQPVQVTVTLNVPKTETPKKLTGLLPLPTEFKR